jgi:HSP20 family protein
MNSTPFNIHDLDTFFDESTLNNLHNFAKKVENVFINKPENVINDNSLLYDITSHNDKYIIHIDVPGVDKQNLDLSFINDECEIGNKYLKLVCKRYKEDVVFVKCLRKYGIFEKKIKLPTDVDISKDINAQYKDGVLNISVYKKNKTSEEGIKIPII